MRSLGSDGSSGILGALVVLKLPAAATREAVITLAIPTAAMAVILAVQFRIAERKWRLHSCSGTVFPFRAWERSCF